MRITGYLALYSTYCAGGHKLGKNAYTGNYLWPTKGEAEYVGRKSENFIGTVRVDQVLDLSLPEIDIAAVKEKTDD